MEELDTKNVSRQIKQFQILIKAKKRNQGSVAVGGRSRERDRGRVSPKK